MREIIEITDGIPRQPQYQLPEPINLTICEGEQVAILGPNGSGKSIVTGMIMGSHPIKGEGVKYSFDNPESNRVSDNIKFLAFRDTYGTADKGYYHQQRWNSFDRDGQPLVKDSLPANDGSQTSETLYNLFKLDRLIEKEMILLSSGELRKFHLAKAILSNPKILVIENPFIGLDVATRQQLTELLTQLTEQTTLQVMLIVSSPNDIPPFITHIIEMEECRALPKISREEYASRSITSAKHILSPEDRDRIASLTPKAQSTESETIVELKNVAIKYGEHSILSEVNWCVKRGEQWALSGENGAGKSTLLSLICADNPQSYACDISLFGRKRGSGESIWDIKRHIGYVSPEMHRAYNVSARAIEIVASGLHDSIGLNRKMRDEDVEICEFWMDIFGIKSLRDCDFQRISSGEQRLVLLARAFVKDPELLILDEPLHGLDTHNRRLALDIIESFCQRENKSLIMVTHYAEELPPSITNSIHLIKR